MSNTHPLPLDEVLRYLRDFVAVARQGSIARAAEQLFKAPSAVTRSILQLEGTLGCTLFERQPRGMLLNRYGDTVLTRALRIQQELERAAANLGPATAHKLAPLTQLLMGGHKLQLFVALAECRQISVAAQQLGLSRSAIGMSLNRLEESLGVTLFQRMGQGLLVNDQGARLLRHAKLALAEVRHIHADLSALDGCLRGTVTVGALPLCRTRLLPLAIARVLANHPQLDIRTLESPYDELARGLRHGDVDCRGRFAGSAFFVGKDDAVGLAGHGHGGQGSLLVEGHCGARRCGARTAHAGAVRRYLSEGICRCKP